MYSDFKTLKNICLCVAAIVALSGTALASHGTKGHRISIFPKSESKRQFRREEFETQDRDEDNDGGEISYRHKTRSARDMDGTRVVVTGYWIGEDKWTSKRKSATGVRLRQGCHIAVDPRDIPYGTKVTLSDGQEYTAVDTGSALRSRKASRGRMPVIDVFFDSRREYEKWARENPRIQTVSM